MRALPIHWLRTCRCNNAQRVRSLLRFRRDCFAQSLVTTNGPTPASQAGRNPELARRRMGPSRGDPRPCACAQCGGNKRQNRRLIAHTASSSSVYAPVGLAYGAPETPFSTGHFGEKLPPAARLWLKTAFSRRDTESPVHGLSNRPLRGEKMDKNCLGLSGALVCLLPARYVHSVHRQTTLRGQ